MTDEERKVFLGHYALHAGRSDDREHATFWQVAAALQSATWRSREGYVGIEVPLTELAQHVA